MDISVSIRSYVDRMVSSVAGMKALVLDGDTAGIVGMTYSRTDMLAKEVVLMERLEDVAAKDPQPHVKGVFFVRPLEKNIRLLCDLLRNSAHPKFGEYHLFFSNVLRSDSLSQLADADADACSVKTVQEFFADVFAVNSNLFSLNVPSRFESERLLDGLMSSLLALRRRPHVRYCKSSSTASQLAAEIQLRMDQEAALFDFRTQKPSLLLIFDRRDDPVTPLLNQWTYQAMAHEIIGITNNRVKCKNSKEEYVLAESLDKFFESYMYANFGDLGEAVKELVEEFQHSTKTEGKIDTLEEMQKYLEQFPALKSQATSVNKHVDIVSQLNVEVSERNLFDVSQIEQELACNDAHSDAARQVKQALEDYRTNNKDRLRLVLLYAIRYSRDSRNQLSSFIDLLAQSGVPGDQLTLVSDMATYCGDYVKDGELFGGRSVLSSFKRSVARSVKGVENVFTQHKPAVYSIVQDSLQGKLKENLFPYCVGSLSMKERYSEVIVFIVGGATFEEAAALKTLESSNPGSSIMLGGNWVHNSQSFLQSEVLTVVSSVPAYRRQMQNPSLL